jgi:hypothetical protein
VLTELLLNAKENICHVYLSLFFISITEYLRLGSLQRTDFLPTVLEVGKSKVHEYVWKRDRDRQRKGVCGGERVR